MSASWQTFLDQTGAVRDTDGTVLHFGRPPTRVALPQLHVCDHLRIVTLRGPDAVTFLQGQVTADVREVSEQQYSRLAMHLSLKGRGLVSMRLVPAEDGFDLLVPTAMADSLLKLLGKYIVFSKASLALDDTRVVLSLVGGDAIPAVPTDLPAGKAAFTADGTAVRVDGHRTLLVLPVETAIARWAALSEGRGIGGAEHARLNDILAGEGHVLPGAEDLFLPQALNYDVLHGVSFRKGCYTGQEVVARMHFKGQMKQRLQHVSWPGDTPLSAGTVLRDANGKALGELVDSMTAGGQVQALAVLRLAHEGDLYLQGEDGQAHALGARPETLPYELPAR